MPSQTPLGNILYKILDRILSAIFINMFTLSKMQLPDPFEQEVIISMKLFHY